MGSFRRTLGLIRRRLFGNTDDEVRMLKRKIETLEVLIKSMVDIRTLPKAIGTAMVVFGLVLTVV